MMSEFVGELNCSFNINASKINVQQKLISTFIVLLITVECQISVNQQFYKLKFIGIIFTFYNKLTYMCCT